MANNSLDIEDLTLEEADVVSAGALDNPTLIEAAGVFGVIAVAVVIFL